ncbi:LamG-like jellyroll fold domain-containing protein [Streptomyces sp. NPDC058195]|uniref:LamG-like jellyroll fold domain-containing protein n=1 Tax=Streptomyces sp. NPDC058195 TaxID=3346375 RepID=UPI0036EAA368
MAVTLTTVLATGLGLPVLSGGPAQAAAAPVRGAQAVEAAGAPVVSSAEYPDDGNWHEGVGDYGSFTFDSPDADVVRYMYRFSGNDDWSTVDAAVPGASATVKFLPTSTRYWSVDVRALDANGNVLGATTRYGFLVSDGRAPAGGWTLGDAQGSGSAAGTGASPAAAAGTGVTFGAGPGPLGATSTYAELDGTESGYLDAGRHVVDTNAGFSVGAWVNLPEEPTRDQTVISQDGTGLPGFELGYDAASRSWAFRSPSDALGSADDWKVTGGKVVPGAWTRLIGTYDGVTGAMTLYVDGVAAADAVQRQAPWNAAGNLQIGRRISPEGYTAHLKGGLADVQVHDRVVTASEVAALGGPVPRQLAYWDVDSAPGGVAPETYGGTGLTLGGGASVYVPEPGCDPEGDPAECEAPPAEPMWGDGHLVLNGTDAYATRAAGLLAKRDSFSLTGRVRLSTVAPDEDQTVMGLSGHQGSAVTVGYSAAYSRWTLTVTDADSATATRTTAKANGFLPSTSITGDHLALVYSAPFGDMVLYVNGVESARIPWDNAWDFSTTAVQVGRTLNGDASSDFLSGSVDELRLFQGALDESLVNLVRGLADGTSVEPTLP